MSAIDELSTEAAILSAYSLASQAASEEDLDLIFGNNGKTGRSATGNYTLLARATGYSRVYISRILRGKAEPGYKTLQALSKVTGIDCGKIIEYIENQKKVAA